MDAIESRLDKIIDKVNDPALTTALNNAFHDIEDMLDAVGDPDLIIGMLNEIGTYYLINPDLALEMVRNLRKYRHPADIIYNATKDDEIDKINEYVSKMYQTEREQYEKHEMIDDALLPCPRCSSKAITITSRQTRSGDEGATIFHTCEVCGWQSSKHN